MDYSENINAEPRTAEKRGETAEFLRDTDVLTDSSPERNMGAIGNLARTASHNQPTDLKKLEVIPSITSIASDAPKRDVVPIPLTWSDQEGTKLSSSAINAVKNRERRLAADGDIRSFYNDIRASILSAQGGDK